MPGQEPINILDELQSGFLYLVCQSIFILSMNRAAEKAAPKAASIFIDAIKGMNIGDAQKILKGGDTAATDFFKEKTAKNIYDAFKPIIVTASMGQAGTTQQLIIL